MHKRLISINVIKNSPFKKILIMKYRDIKQVVIIIFFISFGIESMAQTTSVERLLNYTYTNYFSEREPSGTNFSGTIYLGKEFVAGKIVNIETNESKPAYLRYNALEDIVEIKLHRTSNIHVLPKVENLKYLLDEYSIIYRKTNILGENKSDGYFIEYYSNKDLAFMAKPILTGKRDKFGLQESTVDLFLEYRYFIQREGNIKRMRLKRSNLERNFSDKKKMKPYFERNRIEDKNDVIAMLEFYTH